MKEAENLLFSLVTGTDAASATEALVNFGVFKADSQAVPLFAGNVVGKPIPVMIEGTYYVRNGDKYREITFTAADIERLAKKQPRDVPFNYDHQRAPGAAGVKGWLRFGESLHHIGHITTPDGQTLKALFATPELTAEARQMVESGVYRDVSVEYRQLDDVLTGCALTSYPVMRSVQFSELESAEPEPEAPAPEAPAAESTPTEEEEMDIEKIKALPKEERAALLDTLLSDHGLDLGGLVAMGEQFKTLKATEAATRHELAMGKAETEINALIGAAHFGLTDEIATGAQEALAWAALDETLNFGDEGSQTPDVPGVIKSLLSVIGKQGKQLALLGGESALQGEDGTAQFGDVDPDVVPDGEQIDENRVSSLKQLAQNYL